VGVRVAKLGNKSMTLEYQIEDQSTGEVLTKAETVMVHFDYHTHSSQPIPEEWRKKISDFEGWK
jgi:acyl-CoA thioester hydrolase